MESPGCLAFFDALVDGRLRLGQTLTQTDLGDVLGLTLSRVREVAVLLEAEGLVESRKRVGLTIFYPNVHFVGNTFQFRGILEREGLRKFAEIVTDEWLVRMNAEHDRIIGFVRQNPVPKVYMLPVKELERAFHDSFVRALNNDRIDMNHRRNSQMMYLLRLLNPEAVGPTSTVRSMNEHVEVLRALENRDGEAAAEALDRHLKGVLHRILTH